MESTPLPIIAEVSRIVTKLIDRLTGDRSDYPLLVCMAVCEALQRYGIQSQVIYGQCAWIEVLEDHTVAWSGCWGKSIGFWVATAYGEVVDLNTAVSMRKISHTHPELKPLYSPPLLWSREVPGFYRYQPEGVAEVELTEERDKKWIEAVREEVAEKCSPEKLPADQSEPEFPGEPILCPGRRLLDDPTGSFMHYDRTLSVRGIPAAPF